MVKYQIVEVKTKKPLTQKENIPKVSEKQTVILEKSSNYLASMTSDLIDAIDNWEKSYKNKRNDKTMRQKVRMKQHKQFLISLQNKVFLSQIGR